MKNVIMAAFTLALFTTTASYAQEAKAQTSSAANAEQKVQVEAAALPDGVKKTLATDAYKEWQVETAWQVKGGKEYYILQLKKGEDKASLQLDANGNKI